MNCTEFFEVLCDNDYEFRFMKAPTYIHAFFDRVGIEEENITLVYGVDKSSGSNCVKNVQQPPNTEPELELTGNPLECPFGDTNYESTIASIGNCWSEEEESHFPIPLPEVRGIVSAFNLRHSDEEEEVVGGVRSVWVVCSDERARTVLVSSRISDGWCTSTGVRCLEPVSHAQISERLAAFQLQHLSITGTTKQQMVSEVICTYNVQGDTVLSKKRVVLEVKWSNAVSLVVPIYDAEAFLKLKVAVGDEDSIVHALWMQLNALAHYMHQLKEPHADAVAVEYDTVPDVIRENITTVLHEASYQLGVRRYAAARSREDKEAEKEVDLEQITRMVASSGRTNKDFMDTLWLLLSDYRDSAELAKYISLVLKIIKEEGCKYSVHQSYSHTRLAQAIAKLSDTGAECPRVTQGDACEMMVELGLEKLLRDYWFILLEAELLTADQLQHSSQAQARAGEGQGVGVAREGRLALLGQLHCITELLLLGHPHLGTSPGALRHLGAQACRSLLPARTTFTELARQREASLNCCVPIRHMQRLLSQNFLRYRLSLTTQLPLQEVQTIFLCSAEQIFPEAIVMPPELSLSSTATSIQEEMYFCYEFLANKNKLL